MHKQKVMVLLGNLVLVMLAVAQPQNPRIDHPATWTVESLWAHIAAGDLVSSDRWSEVSSLFLQPPHPKKEDLRVVLDNFAIMYSRVNGKEADVYVGYEDVGYIDDSLRFRKMKPSKYYKTTMSYHLTMQDSHWLIDKGPIERLATVKAAIRYLEGIRTSTQSSELQANAATTIAVLKRYELTTETGRSSPR